MTLLEKALAIENNKRVHKPISAEEKELVFAYFNRKITAKQCAQAMETKESAINSYMFNAIRKLVDQGEIKL